MNYLSEYHTHKIQRRIAIKSTNLLHLLPDPPFLNFIFELERFTEILEGVDSDDPHLCVGLRYVHTKLQLLVKNYHDLLIYLKEKSAAATKKETNEKLLIQFRKVVKEAIFYLSKNLVDFCSRINVSTRYIYSIQSIYSIEDLLRNLKSDSFVVRTNFYNIQKSANRKNIKKLWRDIYSSAVLISSAKLEEVNKLFPKNRNRLDNRLLTIRETLLPGKIFRTMSETNVEVIGNSVSEKQDAAGVVNQMEEIMAEESFEEALHGKEELPADQSVQTDIQEEEKESAADECSQDDIPMDNETYIKTTFGKPLRQGLAAIVIHQPADPIEFLANFLLKYRKNELRNIERKEAFEKLLLERERYNRHLELEDEKCNPCTSPLLSANQDK